MKEKIKSFEDLNIRGHAVVDCGNVIFEIYKNYFPVICEKQEVVTASLNV